MKTFGTPLSELPKHLSTDLPAVVVAMVSFLAQYGIAYSGAVPLTPRAAF